MTGPQPAQDQCGMCGAPVSWFWPAGRWVHEDLRTRDHEASPSARPQQDAQEGEWRVGSDPSLTIEERWRNFWNVLHPEEVVQRLDALTADLKQAREERDAYRDDANILDDRYHEQIDRALALKTRAEAAEAEVARLRGEAQSLRETVHTYMTFVYRNLGIKTEQMDAYMQVAEPLIAHLTATAPEQPDTNPPYGYRGEDPAPFSQAEYEGSVPDDTP